MLTTRLLVLIPVLFLGFSVGLGQRNLRITSDGAGGVRLGMSVWEAMKSLKGCHFNRTSDGEGVALVGVTCHGKRVMSLYSGEVNSDAAIDPKAKIEFIEVWDGRFSTKDGIRVGIPVREVERRIGKVKEIVLTEIESREFVTFSRQPKNTHFRIYGGIYPARARSTTKYAKGTNLFSIQIWK
jgi:hypothetical protein